MTTDRSTVAAGVQRLFRIVLTDAPAPGEQAPRRDRGRWRRFSSGEVADHLVRHLPDDGAAIRVVEDLQAGRLLDPGERVTARIAAFFGVSVEYFTDDAVADDVDAELLTTTLARLGVTGVRMCRGPAGAELAPDTLLCEVLDVVVLAQ